MAKLSSGPRFTSKPEVVPVTVGVNIEKSGNLPQRPSYSEYLRLGTACASPNRYEAMSRDSSAFKFRLGIRPEGRTDNGSFRNAVRLGIVYFLLSSPSGTEVAMNGASGDRGLWH